MLARAFPREHSIFLFYMQTPDLAVDSDPHRGADGTDTNVDKVAVLEDVAVTEDTGGTILTDAGRPQPPQVGGFAAFGIAITCPCSV